jgi:hypothetical protein
VHPRAPPFTRADEVFGRDKGHEQQTGSGARVSAEQPPAPQLGGVHEQQDCQDDLGHVLGDLGVQCDGDLAVCEQTGHHACEHQHQ